MSKWQKSHSPVDRALSDISRKIESVERQLREMGHETRTQGATPVTPGPVKTTPPVESIKKFFKDALTPPSRRSTSPVRPVRQDLFDGVADPMKELDAEPIAFVPATAPDLFAAAATPSPQASAATAHAGEKLAHYLAAGSVKIPKPTLKRVQRETRNRFFMWLALSLVALWLMIAWIR